jgi:ABC-type transport system involved in cytochrome c biogenesis permease subunit
MIETSVLWLRVATALYGVGLAHSLTVILRRESSTFRFALGAFVAGAMLHLVSLVEHGLAVGHLPIENFFQSISLCGFLLAAGFLIVYARYRFTGLAVSLYPLVFLMALVGSMEVAVSGWSDLRYRNAWLLVHVLLILLGYAALVVTAIASVFYLLQERHLKRKTLPTAATRAIPPLATLDEIISRSMGFGFVFLTLGLIAAITWAFIESGTTWIGDAKIAISVLTWVLCMIMIFLRASAGWRGRKAAILAIGVLCSSAVTWVAHSGLREAFLK